MVISRLESCGVGDISFRLIQNYLPQRQQNVGLYLSEWFRIIRGVSQGYILGPIAFNVFINGLLLFKKEIDICNFMDDVLVEKI